MMLDTNPYAPPQAIEEPAISAAKSDVAKRPYAVRLLWALGRWSVVCGVSAAPSFMLWISHPTPEMKGLHSVAMICGVAVFVIGYAIAECSPLYDRILKVPNARTVLYVGYISRMVLSFLFPLAVMVDMFFGIAAMAIVESLGGNLNSSNPTMAFIDVMGTTVVEGVLLNIALAGYMGVLFGLMYVATPKRPRPIDERVA